MREKVLHYIWQNRLFDRVTLDGKAIQVVQTGSYNDGDGPDFTMVRLRIDEVLWVGAVEIHLRSSDWFKHCHDTDPRYNGVVLHVVLEADSDVFDTSGRKISTAIMEVSPQILRRIEDLDVGQHALRCTPELSLITAESWHKATNGLLRRRMEQKIAKLTSTSDAQGPLQFFYIALMRYMGAHLNNDAMEMIAKSLPYSFLKKHSSDLTALEAMLIGQAGQISVEPHDDYEARLKEEYCFYRNKFGLTPQSGTIFRKLHIRPSSFPARRLAMVAALIQQEESILQFMQERRWQDLDKVLCTLPSEYWRNHFDFGQATQRLMGGAGAETRLSLMINVIIPTAYYFAITRGEEIEAESALAYLKELPPEKNKVVHLFEANGIHFTSAADSQCALELYNEYCTRHQCLSCPVAPEIFKSLHHDE